jgi:hypothetical protein
MTDDERFHYILVQHGCETCKCGHPIDRGCVAWNNRDTGEGTPYSFVEIICQACDTEVARITSWYPEIDDFRECLKVLESDWE